MSKTSLTGCAAAALAVLGFGVFAARWHATGGVRGPDAGAGTWKVTLVATGEMAAQEAGVTQLVPLDFRHQHVFDESYNGKNVVPPRGRKEAGRREVLWRRAGVGGAPQAFRLAYSFRCQVGVHPTPAMRHATRAADAPPADGDWLRPGARVESDHRAVVEKAQALTRPGQPAADQVRAVYDFVSRLDNEPTLDTQSALKCLRDESGDSGGKSRLMVALCRSLGIPARVVTGLVLRGDQESGPHYWAEAWDGGRWQPACPTFRHFGRPWPANYFVLQVGDEDLIRGKGLSVRYGFLAQPAPGPATDDGGGGPAAVWRALSFSSLRPAEQHLVKFLLLLPLAALIVSAYRTLVGVPTFGMFSPALLGLAFLNLQALPWGISIFALTVLAGWLMRRAVENLHLLLVPRTSVVLVLIVVFLIALVMAASRFGVAVTQFLSLFPLVILTHLVERFWTVEAEDGTATAFRTLFWTFLVSVTISVALSPEAVSAWMFHHPETLALVLALLLLLGRYTGYRLTELYRFQDFVSELPPRGAAR